MLTAWLCFVDVSAQVLRTRHAPLRGHEESGSAAKRIVRGHRKPGRDPRRGCPGLCRRACSLAASKAGAGAPGSCIWGCSLPNWPPGQPLAATAGRGKPRAGGCHAPEAVTRRASTAAHQAGRLSSHALRNHAFLGCKLHLPARGEDEAAEELRLTWEKPRGAESCEQVKQ